MNIITDYDHNCRLEINGTSSYIENNPQCDATYTVKHSSRVQIIGSGITSTATECKFTWTDEKLDLLSSDVKTNTQIANRLNNIVPSPPNDSKNSRFLRADGTWASLIGDISVNTDLANTSLYCSGTAAYANAVTWQSILNKPDNIGTITSISINGNTIASEGDADLSYAVYSKEQVDTIIGNVSSSMIYTNNEEIKSIFTQE